MATTTVSLPQEQKDFIDENHLCLSSIVQERIKELMKKAEEEKEDPK